MAETTIVQARPDHLAAFRHIRLEALENHPEAFAAEYVRELESDWEARLQRNLGGNAALFLAFAGETVAGMAGIFLGDSAKVRHSATIWGVYVSPAFRQMGIASRLLQACLDWGTANGVEIVKLAVVSTNEGARQTYERMGFRAYGTEPKALWVEGRFYDEVWMARELEGRSSV